MIRPLLYLLAGLLMAPALALVGSLWLVAVGVPDARPCANRIEREKETTCND